jgi:hypothetical protein
VGDCESSVSRNCLRLLRVPPTSSAESIRVVGDEEKTYSTSSSFTTGGFGLPVPQEPALLPSAARMAERWQHRVSAGQDARSERPATGYGWPEAGTAAMGCG